MENKKKSNVVPIKSIPQKLQFTPMNEIIKKNQENRDKMIQELNEKWRK